MTTMEAVALLERYSNYDGMGIPNLAGCKEAMRVAVDALKEACPELKESEDERIRKMLIEKVEEWHEKALENNMVEDIKDSADIITYLEKQKDSVSNAKYIEDVAHAFEDGRKKGIEEEQKPAESISQLTVQGKGVYKICPRCKERMIRDDSMVCTSMPPQYIYECPKCGERECDTVMYDSSVDEKQKEQKQPLSEKFRPDFPAVADFIESVDNMERNRAIRILEDYLKWAVSSEEECRYTWKELADTIQLGIDAMKEQKPTEYLDKAAIKKENHE